MNLTFWSVKIKNNRRRDEQRVRQLKAQGFAVLTLGQCELNDELRLTRRLERLLPKPGAIVGIRR